MYSQTFIYFFLPELFLGCSFIILLIFNLCLYKFFNSLQFTNLIIKFFLLLLFYLFILYKQQLNYFIISNVIINSKLIFICILDIFYYIYDTFILNFYIIIFKLFIIILLSIILLLSLDYFKYEKFQIFEYPFFLLIALQGIFLLISANDFFLVYLALEIQSFCFYILAAFKKYSNLSIEASLKYFIYGSFSSSIFLFGLSLIYGFTGSLNFLDISYLLFFQNNIYNIFWKNIFFNNSLFSLLIGIIFLSVGILFKLALFPFHFWIADVYEGSPLIVTLFFSVISKISFWILFIKIYYNIFIFFDFYLINFLNIFSFFSIIIGTLISLYQEKIKRLLAFSAIGHMGFLTIALDTLEGLSASLLYFFIYIILLLNIFAIILVFRKEFILLKLKNIIEFSTFLKSNYMLALILIFSLFSIAGIPPLLGFFGKFFIFKALIKNKALFFIFIILFMSIISSIFYVR